MESSIDSPSFIQETVVAGDPVDTHVRVRFSSTYVRDEMMGGSGEERYSNMECLNDLLVTTEAIGI